MSIGRMLPLIAALGLGVTQQEEVMTMVRTVQDMVRIAGTELELSSLRTAMAADIADDGRADFMWMDFRGFVKKNMHSSRRDPSLDLWGQAYVVTESREGYLLRSAGPDWAYRTEDDIVQSLPK